MSTNVVLVREGQDPMTTPRLGVRICGLTILLVDIDDMTLNTHYLLDDPLSRVRGIRGNHSGIGVRKVG